MGVSKPLRHMLYMIRYKDGLVIYILGLVHWLMRYNHYFIFLLPQCTDVMQLFYEIFVTIDVSLSYPIILIHNRIASNTIPIWVLCGLWNWNFENCESVTSLTLEKIIIHLKNTKKHPPNEKGQWTTEQFTVSTSDGHKRINQDHL